MGIGELIEGVVSNNVDEVRRQIAAQPTLVSGRDTYLGSTPLHFAAHRGFREIVDALLAAGADVHAREAVSGSTPLHWAAEGGHPTIARQFIDRGADLEAVDAWFGLTPLGWATVVDWAPPFREDRQQTVTLLRGAGARVDVFTAVVAGEADHLRALVAADPGALARRLGFVEEEMTPLHLAVARKLPEMVRLLVELGADLRAQTAFGLTPLALALRAGDDEGAALLRSLGARDDAASALISGDMTALYNEVDADPDVADTLLFAAAGAGLADAVTLLIRLGADPDVRTRHLLGEFPAQVAPLHLAAKGGHTAAVRALVAGGARPNPGFEDALPTPLHVAAGGGHIDTVRALLDSGADAGARERCFNATPRGWAEHEGHTEVAALLDAKDGST